LFFVAHASRIGPGEGAWLRRNRASPSSHGGGSSMLTRVKALLGKGQDQGFTLIELLIVILIVGILASVATPLYLGYVSDAKTAEAKAIAGSLWTAVQSNAIGNCGVATKITDGYNKAGLPGGVTNPARWSVTPGGDVTVACADGAITPDETVFTINGTA